MTESELYRRSDEILAPFLAAHGFKPVQPGEYRRRTQEGEDRILLSRGPGRKALTHFAVGMSYEPDYLNLLDELVSFEGEDKGFSCGPYLNPVGVTPRPKYWSHKDAATLAKSLDHVLRCLSEVGLPWLETLRDPKVFAANVDPIAALPAGLANEVAGNVEKARDSYSEILRRCRLALQTAGEAESLRVVGKAFVFVAMKMDVESERREEFQRKLNFYPNVKPIRS